MTAVKFLPKSSRKREKAKIIDKMEKALALFQNRQELQTGLSGDLKSLSSGSQWFVAALRWIMLSG